MKKEGIGKAYRASFWSVLFLSSCISLEARVDTNTVFAGDSLQTVVLQYTSSSNRDVPTAVDKVTKINSSIADYLLKFSTAHVRSYYPGSVSTFSMGGGAANHIQVNLNNVSLTSYASGVIDLSLIPSILFQDRSISDGLNGNALGRNALSGSLNLFFPTFKGTEFKSTVDANSIGSRSFAMYGFGQLIPSWKYFSYIRILNSANEYAYQLGNLRGYTSGLESNSVNYLLKFKQTSSKPGEWSIWYDTSSKQNSGSILNNNEPNVLIDNNLRVLYSKILKNNTWSFAQFIEHQKYEDPVFGLLDTNTYYQTTVAHVYARKSWSIRSGLNGILAGGTSRNVKSIIPEFQVIKSYQNMQFQLNGNVYQSKANIGFSGLWQYSSRLSKIILEGGSYYKIPTLNDLFWNPGGNPNLLSERSWGIKASYSVKNNSHQFSSSSEPMWFSNLIQWTPNQSGFWSPQNVKSLLGFTQTLTHKTKFNSLDIQSDVTFYFNKIMKSEISNDQSLGKRLPYIPAVKGVQTLAWNLSSRSAIQMRSFLQGARYTTRDNTTMGQLPAEFWIDLQSVHEVYRDRISITLGVMNVNNATRQSFQYFPLPGRHISFSVIFKSTYEK